MSRKTRTLKVDGLPNEISEDQIKFFFQNKRRNGGGPVESVELTKDGALCSAVVIFEKDEAVDIILGRGDSVTIQDLQASLQPIYDKPSPTGGATPQEAQATSNKETFQESKKKKKKPRKKKKQARDQSVPTNVEDGEKEPKEDKLPLEEFSKKKSKQDKTQNATEAASDQAISSEADSDLDDKNEEDDISILAEKTIKATVIDVCKPKEFYTYYFEDPEINEGPFYEESLLLDGRNKHLYLTFHEREDALKVCSIEHCIDDSNIERVEMSTLEDFDTFSNIISVHGYCIDSEEKKTKFIEFIQKRSGQPVENLIHGEDPQSAIVVFHKDKVDDVSEIAWKCATTFDKVRLITAPVFKSRSVRVYGLSTQIDEKTAKRFFANAGRSGGGEMEEFRRVNTNEVVITYKDIKSCHGVLEKSPHTLCNTQLLVSPEYPCLSCSASGISTKNDPTEESSGIQVPSSKTCSPGQRGQTKMKASKIPAVSSLKGKKLPFLTSAKMLSSNGPPHAFVYVRKSGLYYLKGNKELLKFEKDYHCNISIKPGRSCEIGIVPASHVTGSAEELKEKLENCLKDVKAYLHKICYCEFGVQESHILEFQLYYQRVNKKNPDAVMNVYFEQDKNLAIVIGTINEEEITKKINEYYHEFMNEGDSQAHSDLDTDSDSDEVAEEEEEEMEEEEEYADSFDTLKNSNKSLWGNQERNEVEGERRKNSVESDGISIEQSTTNTFDEADADERNMEDLEEKDVILFGKTKVCEEIERNYKHLKVTLDVAKKEVKLKGLKEEVSSALYDLMKRSQTFRSTRISEDFSPKQEEILKKKGVQDKINEKLDQKGHEAVFNSVGHSFFLHHTDKEDPSQLSREFVAKQVLVETKQVGLDMLELVLKTENGSKFLDKTIEKYDSSKLQCHINVESQNGSLTIIAPAEHMYAINKDVDKFLKDNKVDTKEVTISVGKKEYILGYSKQKMEETINSLSKQGVRLTITQDKFVLKGLQELVSKGEKELSRLCDSVKVQDFVLTFFGIKEYLATDGGKTIIEIVESKKKCIIRSKNAVEETGAKSVQGKPAAAAKPASSPKPQPRTKPPTEVASLNVDDCTIVLVQGDLTGLEVEAIVNPLKSPDRFESALNKAILAKGGPSIQTELNSVSDDEVMQTSAGQLGKCKHILHVVCPVFKEADDAIETLVTNCLEHAERQRFQSIGLPVVGVGRLFRHPPFQACKLMVRAIAEVLNEGSMSLKKIYICDAQVDVLSQVLEQCENTFPDADIQRETELPDDDLIGEHDESPSPRHPRSLKKAFGQLNVSLVLGEITKMATEAIVITVEKGLDLSKGRIAKAVLRYGGDSVQQELLNNFPHGIKAGEYAESQGGDLKCKHIFYAALSHYRPGLESQLKKLTLAILKRADEAGLSSISIPALGTGNVGYPAGTSATAIIEAIRKFSTVKPSLKDVQLVVFPKDQHVYQDFNVVVNGGDGLRTRFEVDYDDEDDDEAVEDDENSSTASGPRTGGGMFRQAASMMKSAMPFKKGPSKQNYGSLQVSVKQGDITREKSDAIVIGIKDSMDLASGAVGRALLKKCGSALQVECSSKVGEMQAEGVTTTDAHGLSCKQLIFVSMDQFSGNWERGVSKLLSFADQKGVKVLSMPALGTGAKHANVNKLKVMIYSAIEKFGASKPPNLNKVKLVLFKGELMSVFLNQGQSPQHRGSSAHHQPTIKVSDSEELRIYAASASDIQAAMNDLKSKCKNAFKEESYKEEHTKRFSDQQIQELKTFGLQHCVQVSVQKENGIVKVKGFNDDGIKEVLKKLSKLTLAAQEEFHNSLHQAVKSSIIWQFERNKKWHDFDPLANSMLESAHNKAEGTCDIKDTKGRTYRVDLKAKKEFQLDDKDQTVGHGVNVKRSDRSKEGEPLPDHWDPMAHEENLKIVQLNAGSSEYKKVLQHFQSTSGSTQTVRSIERIQNKSLYQQYAVKKRDLDIHNPKGHQNEMWLFHGTSANSIEKINANGFNRSYCGANGTAFGDGVYFATQSSYSVGYTRADASNNRKMYVAKVLTGMSTISRSGDKFLPYQPGKNRPYDSGGNGSNIRVIFHDSGAYPEYLLTF